jgi:FtsH-binding integral membrane protein
MPSLFSRYATPFTTGLFLVSLVSGVALFFHIGTASFHGMHEWLSMVLIVPFLLHIWKNWRPFLNYFRRPPMTVALVLSLAGGLVFAVPAMTGNGNGGSPQRAVFEAFENATLENIAPLFGHDGESLMIALRDTGLTVAGPQATVAAIGAASGKSAFDVIGRVAAARR